MYRQSIIYVKPELQNRIAAMLREKSEDVYILYELVRQTGSIALVISRLTVEEMKKFLDKNRGLLSEPLQRAIEEHMKYLLDEEYFFSGYRAKDHSQPICKRSYESLILEMGNRLGIQDLGVKAVSRAFFYNYLRDKNYDFTELRCLLRSRGRYFSCLERFLEYCDLTYEEYDEDRREHLKPDVVELIRKLNGLIDTLDEKKKKLEKRDFEYEDVLAVMKMLEAI